MTKPKGFQLRPMSQPKHKAENNGRLSYLIASMASDERILEATPSLKALYAFLATPLLNPDAGR